MAHDIQLNSDGSMPLYPVLFDGPRKVAQAIKIALWAHAGEWLPDRTAGPDYRGWIDALWQPLQGIGGLIRELIAEVDGVDTVPEFSIRQVGEQIMISAKPRTPQGDLFEVDSFVGVERGPRGNLMPVVWSSFDSRRFIG